MAKQFTIWLFIISMLSYSSVWAAHSHEDIIDGDHAFITDAHHTSDQHSQSDSDHCCHASAHLLGLPSMHISQLLPIKDIAEPVYSVCLFSRSTPPPQHPPLS
ncbi:MAG: hypothetical protein DRQ61_08025 [Gammaproteobacteria bacterium]|nr:MAG: hypothetical protein DRQ61_08025 [Gammaproteobacteria bacterium]